MTAVLIVVLEMHLTPPHTHIYIYIYIYIFTCIYITAIGIAGFYVFLSSPLYPVDWGYRTHRLLLCRGVRPPTSVQDMH